MRHDKDNESRFRTPDNSTFLCCSLFPLVQMPLHFKFLNSTHPVLYLVFKCPSRKKHYLFCTNSNLSCILLCLLSHCIIIICLHIFFPVWVLKPGMIFYSILYLADYLENMIFKYKGFFFFNEYILSGRGGVNIYRWDYFWEGKREKYTPGMRTVCEEAQGNGKQRIGAGLEKRTQCFSVFQACGRDGELWE